MLLCIFLVFSVPLGFFSTLLVNLAATFKVSVGTMSQLAIITYLMGIIMGFAMSAIALKVNHKALLLAGVLLYVVALPIYSFAPSIEVVLLMSLLIGAGGAMIYSMVMTLIGECLPLEKRGWAVGLVISTVMASAVIVATLSGIIAGISSWRMVLLWLIFPISVCCLALSSVIVPSKQSQFPPATKPSYKQALKKIFLNKSPISCTLSTTLAAFIGVVPLFAVSFYRIDYAVSPAIGGLFASIAGIGGIIGGIFGGRLVNRYGRKTVAVTTVFISGIACMLFTFIPVIGFSLAVWTIAACAIAMSFAGLPSLSLEQVPEYKASMMSISTAFDNAGTILGIIIGGIVLNLFNTNFHLLMVILGALGASAAGVLLFFAKDPCKRASLNSSNP